MQQQSVKANPSLPPSNDSLINEELFSLAFDLFTCPPDNPVLKKNLMSQYFSLKVAALGEFSLYASYIAIALGVKEDALKCIKRAFTPPTVTKTQMRRPQ